MSEEGDLQQHIIMKHHLPGAGHPTQTREEIQYTKVNVVLP